MPPPLISSKEAHTFKLTRGLINLKIDTSNAMSSDQRREECVFNNRTAGEWAQLATHYSDQLDIYKPALLRFEKACQIVHCVIKRVHKIKALFFKLFLHFQALSSLLFVDWFGFVLWSTHKDDGYKI